jgi:hypothetical protein
MENIAVRSNGQLLGTFIISPNQYQVDPFQQNPTPKLAAQFAEAPGILRITEIEVDVCAITKDNFSRFTAVASPKSFEKPDIRHYDTAVISEIADILDAIILSRSTSRREANSFSWSDLAPQYGDFDVQCRAQ